MFQSVVQSSRESNNKKYRLRYPDLHPTISMMHVKIELISHITKKSRSFRRYITDTQCTTLHLMWPAVASCGWKASEPTFWELGLFSSWGTTTRTGMVVFGNDGSLAIQPHDAATGHRKFCRTVIVEASDFVFPETIPMTICILTRRWCGW
jgi:hypothetical protein